MKISVTYRNAEGEDWQKTYVEDRLSKLKKYLDSPVDARVVLSVEKFRNVAEVNLIADGLNINAKEESKDMHVAIDDAVDKIERQIKKHKEKIRDYKSGQQRVERPSVEAGREEMEDSADTADARVVETKKVVLKPMSLEDALLELEQGKGRFLIYRDFSTERVSVVYRRDDGQFSLLETNA